MSHKQLSYVCTTIGCTDETCRRGGDARVTHTTEKLKKTIHACNVELRGEGRCLSSVVMQKSRDKLPRYTECNAMHEGDVWDASGASDAHVASDS